MDNQETLYIFSDYVCPWCYLGHSRLKKVLKKFKVDTEIIHFPLHPDTPHEGRKLTDLFRCTENDLSEKNNHMQKLMDEENLSFMPRTHTYNSRLAQEIGFWAEKIKGKFEIHDKIYHAYFSEQKNLSDPEVLFKIINSLNLSYSEAKKVISERIYKNDIDKQWETSYKVHVSGVPTYYIDKKVLVGAQTEENLITLVKSSKKN